MARGLFLRDNLWRHPLKFLYSATLSTLLICGTASAQPTQGPHDFLSQLRAAGYTDIQDVEFDNGLWEADARRRLGPYRSLALDPATGILYDGNDKRAVMTRASVMDSLHQQGYSAVTELDRAGGVWDAEAWNARGERVELRISGYDGSVISSEPDPAN